MPTMLEKIVQFGCSIGRRHDYCRRAVCRRHRLCLPPREPKHEGFFRCPFDAEAAWLDRVRVVGRVVERLMKVAETSQAARGRPSPFAPKPVPDHLDLTKPLDLAALIASVEEKRGL